MELGTGEIVMHQVKHMSEQGGIIVPSACRRIELRGGSDRHAEVQLRSVGFLKERGEGNK